MVSPRSLVLAAIALMSAIGCGDAEPVTSVDFYDPPDPLPSDAPGTLIRAEPMEPFVEGSQAWRVLYVSTSFDGTPIAVSGMVAAPGGLAPESGRDVVSWAHGLTGLADRCAPSKGFRFFGHDFYSIAPEILAAGFVGVATDYEGLGTPGMHPYLVGASEGRGVLDIVRAAQQIEQAGAGSRVVVWGLSQGGHAALFAGEIARSWAPDLEVRGVVAVAPGSELQTIVMTGPLFPRTTFIHWFLGLGFEAAHRELSVADIFSSAAIDAMGELLESEACFEEFEAAGIDFGGPIYSTSPLDLPEWPDRLLENSPGHVRSEAPILILQSEDDLSVPILLTNVLHDRLCQVGSQHDYRVLEGLGHDESSEVSVPFVLDWAAARFAGEALVNVSRECNP